MTTLHRIDDFGSFKRQPSLSSTSYHNRPLTASDLHMRYPHQYKCRPSSDILQMHPNKVSPEAEAIDEWFENIQRYEQMLEEVAAASLDQCFKDELQRINQWFQCRSDAERTAALYTVVQNASKIQVRFLITVLEQIVNEPAGQENDLHYGYQHQQQHHHHHQQQSSFPFMSTTTQSLLSDHYYQPQSFKKKSSSLLQSLPPPSLFQQSSKLYPSTSSEPDELRRRDYMLFSSSSRPLQRPTPLYEKALAARQAQLQMCGSGSGSGSGSGGDSSSSTTSSSSSTTTHNNSHHLLLRPYHPHINELWPFPDKQTWKPLQQNHFLSSSTPKKTTMMTKEKSLTTLEQAQERLCKQDDLLLKKRTLLVREKVKVKVKEEEETETETEAEAENHKLTGLARRRKRSSAARALKDKIAAETVDFELMKGK
ncbi:uncharacterized protein BX663DRAFT_525609 [Cokeromyces recurvatus]|uniref:uncharacterized protein n=1 Tax=Cokeromyces recurvatus TaxID=90255 RepID=UPI0022209653|nr:uncharacterized protein BX663DRAFT_525609 [Cokeromyces recurvatus]KAI7898218.1 hypothetical protein BX663DRAFT_525609 [Cokeromyces recurvatus]